MIFEVKNFENELAKCIQQRIVNQNVNNDPLPEGFEEFIGSSTLRILVTPTQQNPNNFIDYPLGFAIKASSIEEAFSKFDQSAKERLEEIKKEQEEADKQIQIATQLPPDNLRSKLIL